MAESTIEWTDAVWNPLRGCSKVSAGCTRCYAIKQANRFSGPGMPYEGLTEKTAAGVNWTGKVMLVPDKLTEPLKWKGPKRIFVNSMSDLFHKEVPDWFIDQVFGVMLANHVLDRKAEHTFQILTKRPERMRDYLGAGPDVLLERWGESLDGIVIMDNPDVCFSEYVDHFLDKEAFFPLPNVWLGVSVENQKAADERIPLLIETPAAVRFLSCEPLLGELILQGSDKRDGSYRHYLQYINWVITGGESGPHARPSHPDWFRSLLDQCQAAGVAFHFKQWGEWRPPHPGEYFSGKQKDAIVYGPDRNVSVYRFGKALAGRLLDGRTWDEFPEVAR